MSGLYQCEWIVSVLFWLVFVHFVTVCSRDAPINPPQFGISQSHSMTPLVVTKVTFTRQVFSLRFPHADDTIVKTIPKNIFVKMLYSADETL